MKISNDKPSIVFVLGMHRSGTSAIANLIASLGFDAGDNLMPADDYNPKGYWEDNDVYRLNNDILSAISLNWDDTEKFQFRKVSVFLDYLTETFSERALAIVHKKLQKSAKIIIKDPRFSILMPFWITILNQIEAEKYYILVHRNPISVSKSLSKRNKFSKEHSLQLWYYYNGCALLDLMDKLHVVSFEGLENNIDEEFLKLKEYLNISDQTTSNNNGIIDIGLIHNRNNNLNINNCDNFPPQIIYLYNYFSSLSLTSHFSIDETVVNRIFDFEPANKQLDQKEYITTLFFEDTRRGSRVGKKSLVHHNGKQKMYFEFKQGIIANDFNLFICDQPCVIYLKSFKIFTTNDCLLVKSFEGNYLFKHNNVFIFDSNSPYLKISLPIEEPIQTIEIDLFIETEKNIILGFVNSVYKFYAENESRKNSFVLGKISETLSNLNIPVSFFNRLENPSNLLAKALEEKELLIKQRRKLILQKKRDHQQIKGLKKEVLTLEKITELQQEIINHQSIAKDRFEKLEKELSNEKGKTDYLWETKISNETEIQRLVQLLEHNNGIIESLNNAISAIKHSASWRITYPLRLLGSIILWLIKPVFRLIKDIGYGFELLKREGIKLFLYRIYWYIRGKRLIEDIENAKKRNKKINRTKKISFIRESNPLVSIIIPVYNNWKYTFDCLQSIHENSKDISYEIIIADDGSTDNTKNIEKIFKNITVLRNKENLHFLKNCNNASKYAKGKYLLFLNNDVLVQSNWLSRLINVIEPDNAVGIVGSKLLFPDGTLQEAGGILWKDGSGWNYGRSDDPEKAEYNYIKETDYVSGACLLIRKSLWEQIGGFDEQYSPAYYEDTDICFEVRRLGYKVIYQPLSKIIHFEGMSNGTDLNAGTKKYQIANQEKFVRKWESTLSKENFNNGENVFLARERSATRKHVLVIDHYVPHFDKDAGSRCTFSYISLLIKMGYNVKFIGDNYYRHEPYTTVLQQLGVEVLYGQQYAEGISSWLEKNGKYFDFVFCNRMNIAPKYLSDLKKHTHARLIYIGHDLNFMGFKRKYEVTGDPTFLEDSKKFRVIEGEIFDAVDVILSFSTVETEMIREIAPNKIVETTPVFFYDTFNRQVPQYDERSHLLYVGGFAHPPNVDAICWFTDEIFPMVKKENPEVKLFIVGSNPPEQVKELSNESIIITGYVDDDTLENYYKSCRVAVIPLRMGAGVKGKLLESLYHQLPAVITSVAAEGVPEIENYTVISDDPDAFASNILSLYNDKEKWCRYSNNCSLLISDHFSEKTAMNVINKVMG